MSLNTQNFTNAGIDMLGAANAGSLLTLTKIVVGKGAAADANAIYPLVALIDWEFDVAITRKQNLGAGKMLVSGVLNEALISGPAFQLRELGIMAKIGTGTEQLYCASNVFADPPDTVTPGGTSSHAFDITIIIDRAANVTVVIGDATVVDCQNIPADATVGPGVYAMREGNIFDFKRLVEGPGIDMTDAADRITIGIRTLVNDLDVYVPASHPQCPDPSVGFPSVQAAHDYLLGFVIPPNRTATIHVWSVTLTTTATIAFLHPNSKQIVLKGEPRVDRTITNITPTGAPLGTTKDVAIAADPALVVGRNVYLYGANVPTTYLGGCKITSTRPGFCTLSQFRKDSQPIPTPTQAGGTMRLSYYPSVLVNSDPASYNSGAPVLACPNGIKSIQNICFEGAGYVLQITEGTLQGVQCIGGNINPAGCGRCLNQYQGFLSIVGENVFSNGRVGIFALGNFLALDQTIVNGCTTGVAPSVAGSGLASITSGQPNAWAALVHNVYGVLAGNLLTGSLVYAYNDYGLAAETAGVITCGAAYGSVPLGNGIDLYAQGLSYIYYDRWQQAVPRCNPPAENIDLTIANQLSYIHVVNSGP